MVLLTLLLLGKGPVFCFLFWLYPQHVEAPEPGMERVPQQ